MVLDVHEAIVFAPPAGGHSMGGAPYNDPVRPLLLSLAAVAFAAGSGAAAQELSDDAVLADAAVLARLEEKRCSLVWRRLPLREGLQWLSEESPVPISVVPLPEDDHPVSLALREASLLEILDLLADFHHFRCRIENGGVRVIPGEPCGFLRTRRFPIPDLACRLTSDPFHEPGTPPDIEGMLGPFLHAADVEFWNEADGRALDWKADAVIASHTTRALDEIERRLNRVRALCGREFDVSVGEVDARVETARSLSLADGVRVQVFATPDPEWARFRIRHDTAELGIETDLLLRTGSPIEVAATPSHSLEILVSAPSVPPTPPLTGEPVARRLEETTVEALEFHDQPLSEVVRFLESRTGLNFAIHPDVFAHAEHEENRISVRLHDLPLDDCIDLICSISRLAWSIEHGAVVIRTPTPTPDMRLLVDRIHDLRFTQGWLDALPRTLPSIQSGRFLLLSAPPGQGAEADAAVAALVRDYPPTLTIELETDGAEVRFLATSGSRASVRLGGSWTTAAARLADGRVAVELGGRPVEGSPGDWLSLGRETRVRITRTGM